MARLDTSIRARIGETLRERLPPHWEVTVGAKGCSFIEADQDGQKPLHEFHAIGSHVIDVRNRLGGNVEATLYQRVPFPPGYCEGREEKDVLIKVRGKGWEAKLIEAIVTMAVVVDAELSAETAEA